MSVIEGPEFDASCLDIIVVSDDTMSMTDKELRKTIPVMNLTMQELMRADPLGCLPSTRQAGHVTVPVMEEKDWAEQVPTVEVKAVPFKDPINPSHYKADGLEVIQIIEAFKLDYHRASALKYLLRAGRKDDELQDMKKCAWFVDRAIKKLEGK